MFDWKENYSVNISLMDAQHKELFRLGGILSNSIKAYDNLNDNYEEIKNILNKLKDYTVYHFTYEESLMDKNEYPFLENHKKEHSAFVNKLLDLQSQDIYINQKSAMVNMLTFLLDWISNHILVTDMKYKTYLNNKGVY